MASVAEPGHIHFEDARQGLDANGADASVWGYSVANGIYAKTVTVKVKYADFNQITRSRTGNGAITDICELTSLVDVLLTPVFPTDKGIRLLGVTLSSLQRSGETTQPQLLLALD